MKTWTKYTEEFRDALNKGDTDTIHNLINANFDLRRSLVPITKGNIEMVEAARSTGASAKFTGSGGAVIGTYKNEETFKELVYTLNKIGIEVIKPNIVK
jgi:glucuronokinase